LKKNTELLPIFDNNYKIKIPLAPRLLVASADALHRVYV